MRSVSGCLSDQEALSNEQIQQLLSDAEGRLGSLQGKANTLCITSTEALADEVIAGQQGIRTSPKLHARVISEPYIVSKGGIAHLDSARLVNRQDRVHSTRPRRVEDPVVTKEKLSRQAKATAGSDWFDLPKTNLTPELNRDLQLIQLRSVLDPKRHYKKENTRPGAPQFSQVGTVIEGPTEFYSARLLRKDRTKTIAEEVLAGEKTSGRFKRKYNDIQVAKRSGKKAHYKKLKARRSGKIGKS